MVTKHRAAPFLSAFSIGFQDLMSYKSASSFVFNTHPQCALLDSFVSSKEVLHRYETRCDNVHYALVLLVVRTSGVYNYGCY